MREARSVTPAASQKAELLTRSDLRGLPVRQKARPLFLAFSRAGGPGRASAGQGNRSTKSNETAEAVSLVVGLGEG
jgi:hypothetical protein